MIGRAKKLRRCLTGLPLPVKVGHLLVAFGMIAFTLGAAPQAHAQAAPRLAVSEFGWEFNGPDRTREYWEVANIGDTPWTPNGYWAARLRGDQDPLFIQIQGVDPVPPGGVLLLEWGRPLDEGDLTTACKTQGNVFCTGRPDGLQSSDFEDHAGSPAIAIFAPTANNQAPTVANGTMLAYFFYGDLDEVDKDAVGYTKAVQSKLWKDGDAPGQTGKDNIPVPKAIEWVIALRMGPGTYPADFGRSSSDYYNTLVGIKAISPDGLNVTNPTTPAPNETNRAGTPARPNYLHAPALPIPGQIGTRFLSVLTQATAASLVANAPATAIQVVGINPDGAVAASLFSNNVWSPWTPMAGVTGVGEIAMVDNPKNATRSLLLRAKADGALSLSTATGDRDKVFGAPADLKLKAQFTPAAAVDPATGNEFYVAVEAGTGAIQVAVNQNGKVGAWQAIPGAKTDAPVAAQGSPDPAGLNIVYWNGNQLTMTRVAADGKFGAVQNLGAAVSERPAGLGPVAAWNPAARRLEVVALTGKAEKAEVQHTRVELTAAGEAKASALAKIDGIGTNALPAIAIDPNSGQIRLLARGGGVEPGVNPGQAGTTHDLDFTENDPQAGFVLQSTFDGTNWSAPTRFGLGRLPGTSPATPLFKAPVAPVSLFDANTKKFQDFLVGEDAQVYHNPGQ